MEYFSAKLSQITSIRHIALARDASIIVLQFLSIYKSDVATNPLHQIVCQGFYLNRYKKVQG